MIVQVFKFLTWEGMLWQPWSGASISLQVDGWRTVLFAKSHAFHISACAAKGYQWPPPNHHSGDNNRWGCWKVTGQQGHLTSGDGIGLKGVGHCGHDLEAVPASPSPLHFQAVSSSPHHALRHAALPWNQPKVDWNVSQNKPLLNATGMEYSALAMRRVTMTSRLYQKNSNPCPH